MIIILKFEYYNRIFFKRIQSFIAILRKTQILLNGIHHCLFELKS